MGQPTLFIRLAFSYFEKDHTLTTPYDAIASNKKWYLLLELDHKIWEMGQHSLLIRLAFSNFEKDLTLTTPIMVLSAGIRHDTLHKLTFKWCLTFKCSFLTIEYAYTGWLSLTKKLYFTYIHYTYIQYCFIYSTQCYIKNNIYLSSKFF